MVQFLHWGMTYLRRLVQRTQHGTAVAKRPHPLKYVKFVPTRDGRGWHAYFDTGNKVNGKRQYTPMGLWGSPGFFDRYATLQGHRTRKQATESALTVAGLIASYERSQAYSKLAEALRGNGAWLESWGQHVGTCAGGNMCSCGLTFARYENTAALKAWETPGT